MKINRPLTDSERSVMHIMAIRSIIEQTGITEAQAVDAIHQLIDEEQLHLVGDSETAHVTAYGISIAQISREDLAAAALDSELR